LQFHLRAYCVASGALKLYLYTRILALFSAVPYSSPLAGEDENLSIDLTPHLTNTSLQTHRGEEGVRLLDELVGCDILSDSEHQWKLTAEIVSSIIDQVAATLAETFKAALGDSSVHFQVHSIRDIRYSILGRPLGSSKCLRALWCRLSRHPRESGNA